MKELSLVIPVYNEAQIIHRAIDEIVAVLDGIADLVDFEIIVVDDGSRDDTWQILSDTVCTAHEQVRAIRLSRNFGKEAALCAGLELSEAKATVIMDADLQHPPQVIPAMLARWRTGDVDVVEGVKSDRGEESMLARLFAGSFYTLFDWLSGIDLRNASDFKLLDRRVVEAWRRMPEKNVFFRGMSAWVGFRREEITFDVAPRLGSKTKWSTLGLFRLALTSIVSYSSAPLHLVTLFGVTFILFSIIVGIDTLVTYFSGEAISGFATVIMLLLITGGFIMVSLGIIGQYLARIYNEVKARPRYLTADDTDNPPARDKSPDQ